MKIILLLCILLFFKHGASQAVRALPLPVYLGLTAYSKRFQDPFSSQTNLGSLYHVDEPSVAICSEMKFMQTGLNYCYGAAAFPFQSGGIAFSVAYVGFDGYSQGRLGAAYGRKIGEKAGLGIQINYHRLSIGGYGSGGALTASLGSQFQISGKTVFGFQIENPLSSTLGVSGEKLASTYSTGIGTEVSEKIFVSGFLIKPEGVPAKLFLHLEYNILGHFSLLGGCSVTTSEAFLGSSISFRNVEVKQLTSWYQGAGISPAISVSFHFKSEK